jgi:membrane protein YqaA with SNARE-associated domain
MHIDPAATAMEQAQATKNPLRKLYFWTLHWADTKYALPALVLLSFAESSFFPIPPDILLMAMCFARPQKWLLYSAWCTVASVAGGVLGWFLGWGFWELTRDFFFAVVPGFTPAVFEKVQHLYQDNAFLAILTAAFTPIPYKVFTVAAGVFLVSIPTLILASIVGRGGRFFLVGGVIRFFGPKARPFLERNFEWATVLLLILFVGGFAAIKYLKH